MVYRFASTKMVSKTCYRVFKISRIINFSFSNLKIELIFKKHYRLTEFASDILVESSHKELISIP